MADKMPETVWLSRTGKLLRGTEVEMGMCAYTRTDIHREAVELIEKLEGTLDEVSQECLVKTENNDKWVRLYCGEIAMQALAAVKKWRGE